jgi:hypothetical protein
MFILNQLSGVITVTWLTRLETAPQVISSSKYVNSRTPPASLFNVLIAFKDVTLNSTIIASGKGIGIQQILVGILTF